ncbi:hypothetical protein BC936DRAFT_138529 [Jimgerdemannia flammicorona]|uniref:DUF1168 domain protein n=1 Tax=Jimgerdemannia flammicorona TaxID=994334 RepID=A0A433C7S7_9FUNG|nr:hypothetical protein BC936DRAFT_138529 [Jimgerdemannia flammicorona]
MSFSQHNPTPSDLDPDATAAAAKKHSHNLSPAELQKKQLERLLKRVDKPVIIPDAPKTKEIKAPKDIVRNVQGSSAGAGSGEFHVYRAHRRREYARLKMLDETAKKVLLYSAPIHDPQTEEQLEYDQKLEQMRAEDEARTAKKRAKRQKKKTKGLGTKKHKTSHGEEGEEPKDGNGEKREERHENDMSEDE